jgi:hypothetical protein
MFQSACCDLEQHAAADTGNASSEAHTLNTSKGLRERIQYTAQLILLYVSLLSLHASLWSSSSIAFPLGFLIVCFLQSRHADPNRNLPPSLTTTIANMQIARPSLILLVLTSLTSAGPIQMYGPKSCQRCCANRPQ